MEHKIRETCSCGAVLDFAESFEYSYLTSASYMQRNFHEVHAKCREKALPKEQ